MTDDPSPETGDSDNQNRITRKPQAPTGGSTHLDSTGTRERPIAENQALRERIDELEVTLADIRDELVELKSAHRNDDAGTVPPEASGATDTPRELVTQGGSPTKVIGRLSDDGGIGVLGEATGSGDTVGIKGMVDSTDGYGIHTPDDAKVDGTTELSSLSGTLTGGQEITTLAGQGLAVDESGALNGHTYKTESFTAAETTWSPISGLSTQTPVELTVDTNDLTYGRVSVGVDGSEVEMVWADQVLHRVLLPTNSVSVTSKDGWGLNTTKDVSSNSPTPTGVAFKYDGTKMFLTDGSKVLSYTLSSAWDISTASFSDSLDLSSETLDLEDLAFKPDGTKLFVIENYNVKVYSYDLSTAWTISSASLDTSTDVRDAGPTGLTFNNDGSKMTICTVDDQWVASYDLSSNWDVSTASLGEGGPFYDAGLTPPGPKTLRGLAYNNTGGKLFIVDDSFNPLIIDNRSTIYIYTLSTAFDISTASIQRTIGSFDRPRGIVIAGKDEFETSLYVTQFSQEVLWYDRGYEGSAAVSVKRE